MWIGPSKACTRPLLLLPSGRFISSNTTFQLVGGWLPKTLVLYMSTFQPHW